MSGGRLRCLTGRVWEIWRPAVGFPDYEVSSMGRVRSVPRLQVRAETPSRRGHVRRLPGKVLRPWVSGKYGHRMVTLYRDEAAFHKQVHRLVLEAFVGPRPDGLEACHWNGRAGDNRLGNLRWDTHAANVEDAMRHGTVPRGAGHHMAKLTEDAVRAIRTAFANGARKTDLAVEYGVDRMNIHCIVTGHTWKHV